MPDDAKQSRGFHSCECYSRSESYGSREADLTKQHP